MSNFILTISNDVDLTDKIYQGSYEERIIIDERHLVEYKNTDPEQKDEIIVNEGVEIVQKIDYMTKYSLSFIHNVDVGRFLARLKIHDNFSYIDYRGETITPDEWDISIDEVNNDLDTHYVKITIDIKLNLYSKFANNINFIEELGVNNPPYATSVEITGDNELGSTLTGNYTYNDDEGDLQGISLFKWYRSDNQFGLNKQLISGSTTVNHVIVTSDLNKWLTFQVQPVSIEPVSGDWVESDFFNIQNNTAPEAQNVETDSITPRVGDTVIGSYDYFDAEGDAEGSTLETWYIADDDEGFNETYYAGGSSVVFTADLEDKNFQYRVKPIAQTGIINGVITPIAVWGVISPELP